MTEPTPTEWLDVPVRITRDAVYFGDHKLPGVIADDGVSFRPGFGTNVNRLTVEFYVGVVTADDSLKTRRLLDSLGQEVTGR